jgi:hypothetical protein
LDKSEGCGLVQTERSRDRSGKKGNSGSSAKRFGPSHSRPHSDGNSFPKKQITRTTKIIVFFNRLLSYT